MSEGSYEDVWEITQLDKIWKAQTVSKFEKYIGVPLVLSLIFLAGVLLLGSTGIWMYLLIVTIDAYLSGEDLEYLTLLFLTGIIVIPFMFISVIVPFALIFGGRVELRYLIRFKIFAVSLDFSGDNISVIEALTRTLESRKGWINPRTYKRNKLNNTQLALVQKYLIKKYQRDVTVNECLQSFSIGIMNTTESGSRRYKEYAFVMLDEKKGEILFYSNDYDEWLYLREELEEKGFHISGIRETTVDMADYVINDDGTIERNKKRRRKGDTFSLEDSEIKNV